MTIINEAINLSQYFWQACIHIYSFPVHCGTARSGEHCLQLYRQVDTRRKWKITIDWYKLSPVQQTTIVLPFVMWFRKYVSFVNVIYFIQTHVRITADLIRLYVRSIGSTQRASLSFYPPHRTSQDVLWLIGLGNLLALSARQYKYDSMMISSRWRHLQDTPL